MNNNKLYDFGGFRLDEEQKCLWRDDEIVSLTPKAYDTLCVLIRNKGKVISKNALLDEVWANTFVEEATLAQNISTLRKTLAKYDPEKEFIATIPRRGYRFVEEVTEVSSDEQELVLEKHSVTQIVAEQKEIHDTKDRDNSARTFSGLLSRKWVPAATVAGGLALAAIAYTAISYYNSANSYYNARFQRFQFKSVFSSSNVRNASVSPDGKYVAIIESRTDGDSILLKQIEDGNTIEVLPKSSLIVLDAEFSPAGDYIYYSAYKRNKGQNQLIGSLYKIPILGGGPQEVIKDVDSPVAISSDSKKIAFVRNLLDEKKSLLMTADIDGENVTILAKRELVSGFSRFGPSWSPDQKFIAAAVAQRGGKKASAEVALIDAESGEVRLLTDGEWLWIGRTSWLQDGSGLAFVAYGSKSPNLTDEVWFVSYPDGKKRLITNGFKGVNGIGITDDGKSIVASKLNRVSSLNVAPLEDLDNVREITKSENSDSLLPLGAVWNSNESLVYGKSENGNSDLWSVRADGSNAKQITSSPAADYSPAISRDGKRIYFVSNRGGAMDAWRTDVSGENPTQITNRGGVSRISLSGEHLYYLGMSPDNKYVVLWRSDLDGKNEAQITKYRTYGADISPDGKYVFCFFPNRDEDPEDLSKPVRFTVLSSETGEIVEQFGALKSRNLPLVQWAPDSRSFIYIENEPNPVLWKQELGKKEPAKLKDWKNGNIYQIALSGDGKKLFYEKGEEINSVVLIEDKDSDE